MREINSVQERLRRVAHRRGIELQEIADHFNWKHQTVQRIGSPGRPEFEKLRLIAAFIDVDFDWLMGGGSDEIPSPTVTDRENQQIQALNQTIKVMGAQIADLTARLQALEQAGVTQSEQELAARQRRVADLAYRADFPELPETDARKGKVQ